MRPVHFDCIGGASGNMLLGALLDAGAPLSRIETWLHRLPLDGWQLRVETVTRSSIGATHVHVEFAAEYTHRHLSDIRQVVQAATLPDRIAQPALAVFQRLAEAEARVHRIEVEEVHFHEVGAVDAIIDVVGTVAALHELEAGPVSASPLPMGHGLIQCQHGTFPNPPPATVELLKGVPTRAVDIEAELVTPTGAALLVGLGATFGPPLSRWEAIGYGAGTRSLPFPNVVRVLLGSATAAGGLEETTLVLLETNIDDASPQLFGPLMETLLGGGALDVTLTPVYMKKGRPGVMVSVLCPPAHAPTLRGVLLTETPTLGVREQTVSRWHLPRRMAQVSLFGGTVAVKLALAEDGKVLKVVPEFDQCLALARQSHRPVHQVVDAVRARAWQECGGDPGWGVVKFKASDVPVGEGRVVEVDDRAFAVFNLGGKLYALDNVCPHRGGPIGEGMVDDGVVVCPWHGWEFDIRTGEGFANPDLGLATWPVEVDGDEAKISY